MSLFLRCCLTVTLVTMPVLKTLAQDGSNVAPGQIRYLLFDDVNLRTEPDTNSEIIKKLSIGSSVKIISETTDTFRLSGVVHYWYEVEVANKDINRSEVKGYLWGGFFAKQRLESKNDPGVIFLYGVARIEIEDWGKYEDIFGEVMGVGPEDWGKVPVYQIRAVGNGEELARLEFKGIGSISTDVSCKLLDNRGVRNVNKILHFNFDSSVCGGAFGNVYVFWDKAVLHFVKSLIEGADAPVFTENYLIFPKDKNGKEGIVIWYKAEGEANDDGTITYEYQRNIKLMWTGCELKKILK